MEKSFSVPIRITVPISYMTYLVREPTHVISDVFCSYFHSCPLHLCVMSHCHMVMYLILALNFMNDCGWQVFNFTVLDRNK